MLFKTVPVFSINSISIDWPQLSFDFVPWLKPLQGLICHGMLWKVKGLIESLFTIYKIKSHVHLPLSFHFLIRLYRSFFPSIFFSFLPCCLIHFLSFNAASFSVCSSLSDHHLKNPRSSCRISSYYATRIPFKVHVKITSWLFQPYLRRTDEGNNTSCAWISISYK